MLGKNIEPATYTEIVETFSASIPSRQKNGSIKSDLNNA